MQAADYSAGQQAKVSADDLLQEFHAIGDWAGWPVGTFARDAQLRDVVMALVDDGRLETCRLHRQAMFRIRDEDRNASEVATIRGALEGQGWTATRWIKAKVPFEPYPVLERGTKSGVFETWHREWGKMWRVAVVRQPLGPGEVYVTEKGVCFHSTWCDAIQYANDPARVVPLSLAVETTRQCSYCKEAA